MKNHHEVSHFKSRMMILLLSLAILSVMAGQSFAASCSTCHGMPPLDSVDGKRNPASGAFAGNHQKHLGSSPVAEECVKCHSAATSYDMKHAATSGNKIGMNTNINNSTTTATYSKGVFFNQTSVPVMGSCSNVNCHFERNTTTRTPAPVWGTDPAATNCSTCHDTPRGAANGSHKKHEDAYGGTASCIQCHPNYGTTNFSHATSAGKDKIKVNSASGYSGGTSTSWLPSQSKSYGTCSTAICHDNGRGVKVETPVWGAASVPACSSCHEAAPSTFTHTKHLSGLSAKFNRNAVCADCHKGYIQGLSVTSDHIDGSVDVYSATPGDLGYPQNKIPGSSLASCTTSNCHSNGKSTFASATWGGSSTGCNFCHPNLSAGHAIHVNNLLTEVTFYNYTATSSSGSTYKFGCANCHPLSIANHMNSSVEVVLTASASGGHLKALNGIGASMNGSLQCSNVYCHSNGYSAGSVFATTPAWGGSFTGDRCASCHGNSPNSSISGSSAHSAHVVGIHYDDIYNGVSKKLPIGGGANVNAAHGRNNRSTTINCNICHAATVSTFANDLNPACSGCHNGSTAPLKNSGSLIASTANHVNGQVDVSFIDIKIATKAQLARSAFAGYTAANAGGWSRNNNIYKTYTSGYDVTKVSLRTAAGTSYLSASGCSNVACHNGKTVKWTDNLTCTSCHTRLK